MSTDFKQPWASSTELSDAVVSPFTKDPEPILRELVSRFPDSDDELVGCDEECHVKYAVGTLHKEFGMNIGFILDELIEFFDIGVARAMTLFWCHRDWRTLRDLKTAVDRCPGGDICRTRWGDWRPRP